MLKELKQTAYYLDCNFASFTDFFNKVKDFENDNCKINSIVRYDYELLLKKCTEEPYVEINKKYSKIDSFISNYTQLSKILKRYYPKFECPKLYIVETLPRPFEAYDWDAMNVAEKDELEFGIPKGIYFLKKYLTHCYFEYIISHELVHEMISQNSEVYYPYTSIEEEGICDLLGLYFLTESGILPDRAIVNLIQYNRAIKSQNSRWFNYYKSSLFSLNYIANKNYEDRLNIDIKREDINLQNTESLKRGLNLRSNIISTVKDKLILASSISTIDIESYELLKYLVSNEITNFTLADLDIEEANIDKSITKLLDNGIIFQAESMFHNPLLKIPSFLKYKI